MSGFQLRLACALAAFLMIMPGCRTEPDTVGPLPEWAAVDRDAAPGFKVTGVVRHREFVRLRVVRDDVESGLEIRFHKPGTPGSDRWTTRYYELQAAPGMKAPEELLGGVLARLKAAERDSRAPFVLGHPADTGVRDRQGWVGATAYLSDILRPILFPYGLAAIGLALLVLVMAKWSVRPGRRVLGWLHAGLGAIFDLLLRPGRLVRQVGDDASPGRYPRSCLARDALWMVMVAAAVYAGLRYFLPGGMLFQIDMGYDMLSAHQLLHDGLLPRFGGMTSFARLCQGTGVVLLWQGLLALGLDVEYGYHVMLASNALAVAVLAVWLRRRSGIVAAVTGAVVFLVYDLAASSLVYVWSPSLLPLPIVLFFVSVTVLAERPTLPRAALSGLALAVAANVHVLAFVMLPTLLFVCGMAGRRRLIGIGLAAIGAFLAALLLLCPVALANNLGVLMRSGWLLPAIAGVGLMPVAGIVLSERLTEAEGMTRGVFVSDIVTVFSWSALLVMSAVSGRGLSLRYGFVLAPGLAILGGHLVGAYFGVLGRARGLKWKAIMAAVAVACAISLVRPVGDLWSWLSLQVRPEDPTFSTMRQATVSLFERGLKPWDMKWAVQTPEYPGFVRLVQQYAHQYVGETVQWKGEPIWQLRRLPKIPKAHPLPEGMTWFSSGDGSGLIMEELRPWIRREQMEVCFQDVEPADGVPACAVAELGGDPGIPALGHMQMGGDERHLGPFQQLSSKARAAFRHHPGSVTRITYRIPVRPFGDDRSREVRLVGSIHSSGVVREPHDPNDWWIVGVEGMGHEGRLPARGVRLTNPGSGPGAGGTLILQLDLTDDGNAPVISVPPTWFEIRPGRPEFWGSATRP